MAILYDTRYVILANNIINENGRIFMANKDRLSDILPVCESNINPEYIQYITTKYESTWETIYITNNIGNIVSFIIINKATDSNNKYTVDVKLICSSKKSSFYSQILMAFTLLCIKRNPDVFNQICVLEVARYYNNTQAYCFYSKMGFQEDMEYFNPPFSFVLLPMKCDITSITETMLLNCFSTPNQRLQPKTSICINPSDAIIQNKNELLFFNILLHVKDNKRIILTFILTMLKINNGELLQDVVDKLQSPTISKIYTYNLKPFLGIDRTPQLIAFVLNFYNQCMHIPKEQIQQIILTNVNTHV